MTVKIITDGKWKEVKYDYEVPKTILDDYYFLDECDKYTGWINYRDRWFHLSDFMSLYNKMHCVDPPNFMKGWDGYHSDSFFSGVLIELSACGEGYRIGTYMQ